MVGIHDAAAELLRHGLHAVADAEHGHAELEHRLRRARRSLSVTDSGPREMMPWVSTLRTSSLVTSQGRISQNAELAHAARDELLVYWAPKSRIRTREVDVGLRTHRTRRNGLHQNSLARAPVTKRGS